jgi:hypothetical protein
MSAPISDGRIATVTERTPGIVFLVLSAQAGITAGSSDNDANLFNANDDVVDLWLYDVARHQTGMVANANMACTVAKFDFIQ